MLTDFPLLPRPHSGQWPCFVKAVNALTCCSTVSFLRSVLHGISLSDVYDSLCLTPHPDVARLWRRELARPVFGPQFYLLGPRVGSPEVPAP
jgi:hypothetical protein